MGIRIKEQSAWRSQVLVTKALLQRELITRFGKYKLGAIWILIDPLVSVIVLGIMLGPFLGRSSGVVPYPFFLLCGFMLLSMLTGPINSGLSAISANQGLLVFKKVQAIDPFIARFIFLLLTNSAALIVFCIIAYWLGVVISLNHLPEAIICVILTWVIGSGLGLQLGVACLKFTELEKVIQYIQRPLLFVSAVLYPIDAIPPEIRKYLLYNPLVHTIECLRMALFPSYVVESVNLYYPAAWALIVSALGLMTYRNNRHFLTQR
jgi:capsular polysaccharide transport system permease protein